MKKCLESWMRNLSKLRTLSLKELVLLIHAFVWLGVIRLALWRQPFHRIISRLGLTQTRTYNAQHVANAKEAARIGWAVKVSAARTPWHSTCLIQALVGMKMLNRHKIAGLLCLGITKNESAQEPFAAHAWLCSGDLFVTGENCREPFTEVAIFTNQNVAGLL